MKRRISIILIAMIGLIISSNLSVMAYELPHAFWGLDAGYSNATSSKNYDETINYGVQIINLISSEPKNEQTINILGSRTYDVAFAYFMNGDYTNAAKYFEMYIPYGKQLGWTDGVIIAENCVKQFTNIKLRNNRKRCMVRKMSRTVFYTDKWQIRQKVMNQ